MGAQQVDHPTRYKTRKAADRMSVLLVIDRGVLDPYTKAAKDAHIDRNSILCAMLGQAAEGKANAKLSDAVIAAKEHNANTHRSLATKARRANQQNAKPVPAPAKPVSNKKKKSIAKSAAALASASASPSSAAKPKTPKKAASKKSTKSAGKSAAKSAKTAAKSPAKSQKKAPAASKTSSKRPSKTLSAAKSAKPAKAVAGKSKRAAGRQIKRIAKSMVPSASSAPTEVIGTVNAPAPIEQQLLTEPSLMREDIDASTAS